MLFGGAPVALGLAAQPALAGQAGVIAPYPTLSEISKRVAGSYYTPALFGARTRKLVRALQWLG